MSLQLVMLVTLVKMSLTPMMRILSIMLAKFVTAVMMIGTLKMMMYGSYSDNTVVVIPFKLFIVMMLMKLMMLMTKMMLLKLKWCW